MRVSEFFWLRLFDARDDDGDDTDEEALLIVTEVSGMFGDSQFSVTYPTFDSDGDYVGTDDYYFPIVNGKLFYNGQWYHAWETVPSNEYDIPDGEEWLEFELNPELASPETMPDAKKDDEDEDEDDSESESEEDKETES